MKRASVVSVCALCIGLAIGCGGRNRNTDEQNASNAKSMKGRPQPITETGCLTSSGDTFVLTDLVRGEAAPNVARGTEKPNAGQTATQVYQLIGDTAELRKHVGRQVRVSGEAEPPKVAEVRESTPAAPPAGTAGTSGKSEPQVSSETEARLEVTKLRVSSVTETGETCQMALPTANQNPR